MLSLPYSVKKIDRASVEDKLNLLTLNIDKNLSKQINNISDAIVHASQDDMPFKNISYLQGHPGTGNPEVQEAALASRMQVVRFPRVSLEDRKKIAYTVWNNTSRGLPLDPDVHSILDEIILRTDQRFDGLREMKTVIGNYIVEKTKNKDVTFDVDSALLEFEKPLSPASGIVKQ